MGGSCSCDCTCLENGSTQEGVLSKSRQEKSPEEQDLIDQERDEFIVELRAYELGDYFEEQLEEAGVLEPVSNSLDESLKNYCNDLSISSLEWLVIKYFNILCKLQLDFNVTKSIKNPNVNVNRVLLNKFKALTSDINADLPPKKVIYALPQLTINQLGSGYKIVYAVYVDRMNLHSVKVNAYEVSRDPLLHDIAKNISADDSIVNMNVDYSNLNGMFGRLIENNKAAEMAEQTKKLIKSKSMEYKTILKLRIKYVTEEEKSRAIELPNGDTIDKERLQAMEMNVQIELEALKSFYCEF